MNILKNITWLLYSDPYIKYYAIIKENQSKVIPFTYVSSTGYLIQFEVKYIE
jgi:hypothetical protein